MAINQFIPTIWSARLLNNLTDALVYAQPSVVNRDYEGEIAQMGDTVRINTLGPVTIGAYAKNANMAAVQELTDASQVLSITQGDYFNFQIDDVDRRQQQPKVMDQAMRNAALALADTADAWLAGIMWAGVPAGSTQGAVGAGLACGYGAGETDPYIALLNASIDLDENNVPRAGRWAIVPPWFHGYLLMDNRFVGSGAETADGRAVNGLVGRAAGFDIYMTNNVPFVAGPQEYKILLGTNYATSFVEQINSVEAYRPELRFADAVKGLHLYGARVVYPAALALIIANIGTAA
jgi:hypothetical protein